MDILCYMLPSQLAPVAQRCLVTHKMIRLYMRYGRRCFRRLMATPARVE